VVERGLKARLHPRIDVRVAVLLALVLDRDLEPRMTVHVRQGHRGHRFRVRRSLEHLGVDKPLVGNDLLKFSTECDFEPAVGDQRVAVLAPNP
jgi:hypothetical protein